jgi:hypothetical protein
MTDTAVDTDGQDSVEQALRAKLARGDALAGTVQPILRHLLDSDNASVFSDEILARVRGMAADLASQLLNGEGHVPEHDAGERLDHSPILTHLHALALEWQLTERLEQRCAIDPVVPPLLQAVITSAHDESKAAAMKVLSVQARWCQAQRRMQLPLGELPAELFDAALLTRRAVAGDCDRGDRSEAWTCQTYDEGPGRLALLARLVTSMGGSSAGLLDLGHAGVALFLSALALGSRQERDRLILSTHEARLTRFGLALRAAGLVSPDFDRQILTLHPDAVPDREIAQLRAAQATAILGHAAGTEL